MNQAKHVAGLVCVLLYKKFLPFTRIEDSKDSLLFQTLPSTINTIQESGLFDVQTYKILLRDTGAIWLK